MTRVLVVFFDPPEPRYGWLLKPGFRHVFAIVDDGAYWIMVDARDGSPVIQVLQTSDYDIAAFYRGESGYTVVETGQVGPLHWPLIATNCVGMVKAVLGLNAPLAITPWQLYRRIKGNRS